MRGAFEANFAIAIATGKQQLEAFNKLKKTLVAAGAEMQPSYDEKLEGLGSNDDEVVTPA